MKRIGDLTIPKTASSYARVPADRLEEFQAFRRTFPYKDMSHDGVTWSYLTGGLGDPPLLLLSGAFAIPDISWTTIVSFVARRTANAESKAAGALVVSDRRRIERGGL